MVETEEQNNVSTAKNNVEQTEPSLAKQTQPDEDELQDLPLPTLLTDSDFSNNPFLEEQVEETTEAIGENEEGGEKGNEEVMEGKGEKGNEEQTTRKSFSLQGIRVTVREGGGRRWKQGSQTKILDSDLKKKPAQVTFESDNRAEQNVEEGEKVKNLETGDEKDPSLTNDNSPNNLVDLISVWPASNEGIEENVESEALEEEAVGVKLNISRSGGIGGAGVGDSDKGQAGSGATLLPSLMDRQGGREERGEGDNGQRDAGKDEVEARPGLEHFLRIGATMQEGLSLLAEEHSTDSDSFLDSKVLERNIVRTGFSSASEKIHPLLLRHPILCLLLVLIPF